MRSGERLHLDHRLAIVDGGTNHPSNLRVTRARCNLRKAPLGFPPQTNRTAFTITWERRLLADGPAANPRIHGCPRPNGRDISSYRHNPCREGPPCRNPSSGSPLRPPRPPWPRPDSELERSRHETTSPPRRRSSMAMSAATTSRRPSTSPRETTVRQ